MSSLIRTRIRAVGLATASAAGGTLWSAGGLAGGAGALTLVALPLLLLTLLSLVAQLQGRLGVFAHWARGLAWLGAGLAFGARAAALMGGGVNERPWFGVGMFVFCAALIVLGGGALRGTKRPGWEGVILVIGLLGLFLPVGAGISGTVGLAAWTIWGCGWIWIANVLWLLRVAPGSRATIERLARAPDS